MCHKFLSIWESVSMALAIARRNLRVLLWRQILNHWLERWLNVFAAATACSRPKYQPGSIFIGNAQQRCWRLASWTRVANGFPRRIYCGGSRPIGNGFGQKDRDIRRQPPVAQRKAKPGIPDRHGSELLPSRLTEPNSVSHHPSAPIALLLEWVAGWGTRIRT